ncbi:MAG: hypothetical protein ACLGPM_10275 [Acidobacteriota bacterium]
MNEAFLKTMEALVAGILSLSLFATLIIRRIARILPAFTAYMGLYIAEAVVATVAMYSVHHTYRAVYLGVSVLDLIFSMSVLAEIGGNVLRSNQMPTDAWIKWPALLFGGSSLLLWPLVRWANPPHLPFLYWMDLRLTQASSIGSIAAVLALLTWSNALKLHWPERELRVMIGMSLESLVAFAVLVLYVNGKVGHQYYWLDLFTPLAGICALAYWLHYFWLDASATAPLGEAQQSRPIEPDSTAQEDRGHFSAPAAFS